MRFFFLLNSACFPPDGKNSQFRPALVSARSSDCSSRKTSAPLSLYMKLITTNSEGGKRGRERWRERGREETEREGGRLIDRGGGGGGGEGLLNECMDLRE